MFRTTSVILTGLDASMKPGIARSAAAHGFIKPFPEAKVIHQIKTLAITICKQGAVIDDHHDSTRDGSNPLVFFTNAVHRQCGAFPHLPVPVGSRSDSDLSMICDASSENGSTSVQGYGNRVKAGDGDHCASTGVGGDCQSPAAEDQLPSPIRSPALALEHWDGVYYALVAEIRRQYSVLQERHGFGHELSSEGLIHGGVNEVAHHPAVPIEWARLLEEAWYVLMDSRLVATLDRAVHARESRHHMLHLPDRHGDSKMPADQSEGGLVDVNSMTVDAIITMLWQTIQPRIAAVCSQTQDEEARAAALAAAKNAQEKAEGLLPPPPARQSTPRKECSCRSDCVCRRDCDRQSTPCGCYFRVQLFYLVDEQNEQNGRHYVERDPTSLDLLPFDRISSIGTEARIDNASDVDDQTGSTPSDNDRLHSRNGRAHLHSTRHPGTTRLHANTDTLDLAHVPHSISTRRGTKDETYLGLDVDRSGQRFPPLFRYNTDLSQQQPVPAPTKWNFPPPRKPVPGCAASPSSIASSFGRDSEEHIASVMDQTTASSCNNPGPPGLTQSYPVAATGNVRGGYGNVARIPLSPPDKFHSTSVEQYENSTGRHPTADERSSPQPDSVVPRRLITPTRTPPQPPHAAISSPTSSIAMFGRRSLNFARREPELPLPDFISPRPALRQRYVSAGGTARLADREEIPAPRRIHRASLDVELDNTPNDRDRTDEDGAEIARPRAGSTGSDTDTIGTIIMASLGRPAPIPLASSLSAFAESTVQSSDNEVSYMHFDEGAAASPVVRAARNLAKIKKIFHRKGGAN